MPRRPAFPAACLTPAAAVRAARAWAIAAERHAATPADREHADAAKQEAAAAESYLRMGLANEAYAAAEQAQRRAVLAGAPY